MNSNCKLFQYESIAYSITKNEHVVIIQILKHQQVEAEQTYTLNQFRKASYFFYQFLSLQSIYDELVSLGNDNNIDITENNNNYSVVLIVNQKEVSEIKLVVPKQFSTPQSIVDQSITQKSNDRVDMQDALITAFESKFKAILKKNVDQIKMEMNNQSKRIERNQNNSSNNWIKIQSIQCSK